MARITLRRPHRKVCIGDMDTLVTLSERAIVEPAFGETNFDEKFPDAREVWAKIRTINGRTLFNGTDADISLTHEVSVRYDPAIGAETWIQLFDGTRLDVIDTQDLEERNEFIVMLCNARGTTEAAKA